LVIVKFCEQPDTVTYTQRPQQAYFAEMEEPVLGFIGLGRAGFPIAACLARKGHRLLVRDADPARGIQFVEEHAKCRVATSDSESFSECETVITMLPSDAVVKHVLLGEYGIAPHLRPGMGSRYSLLVLPCLVLQ
jgi:phosphoglycerate dehydrogenase-like enzyme